MSQTRVPTTLTSALPTIAAMQGIASPTTGMSVEVVEEGQGGTFVFNAALTAAANNGTTFKATDATVGSWTRQFSGEFNVKWFGAIGNGVRNDTAEVQAAINAVIAAGGGEVFLPAGSFAVTTLTASIANRTSFHIRGAGSYTTQLVKFDATTTPVLDLSSNAGLSEWYGSISDLRISGLAKGGPGLRMTNLARFRLDHLRFEACSTGFDNLGSLIFSVHDCVFSGNNVGYKSRSANGINCNAIEFNNGTLMFNTVHAIDVDNSLNLLFNNVTFENNGTSGNLATGAALIEPFVSNLTFNSCWFEDNFGMTIEVNGSDATRMTLRACFVAGAQGGNVMNVNAISSLIIESIFAGTIGDTVTSAAARTLLLGGLIHTYVDNSITTRINFVDSTGTTVQTTPNLITKEAGGISAEGDITNVGQDGPFGFISCSTAGLARVGGYDYDAAATLPLNLFATMVQIPPTTTVALSDVTHPINTSHGKIQGTMVFNQTENIPMYATASFDNSTWVGEKAGATITITPIAPV